MLPVGPKRFEELVQEAIDGLPAFFQERLENVGVVIEEEPEPELLEEMGMDPERDTLYGLYEGIPLTERELDAVWQLPDKVTIFRRPLLEDCRTEGELVEEVQVTVVHEIAHFFGIDEETLHEYGWD